MSAPEEQEPASPVIATSRTIDIATSLVLVAFAALLAYDNWRTGMSWDATGPQAGYFPFYLSLVLGYVSGGQYVWSFWKQVVAKGL